MRCRRNLRDTKVLSHHDSVWCGECTRSVQDSTTKLRRIGEQDVDIVLQIGKGSERSTSTNTTGACALPCCQCLSIAVVLLSDSVFNQARVVGVATGDPGSIGHVERLASFRDAKHRRLCQIRRRSGNVVTAVLCRCAQCSLLRGHRLVRGNKGLWIEMRGRVERSLLLLRCWDAAAFRSVPPFTAIWARIGSTT